MTPWGLLEFLLGKPVEPQEARMWQAGRHSRPRPVSRDVAAWPSLA